MKILISCTFCVLLSLCLFSSYAQKAPITEPDYNKPRLFADLPQSISIDINALENLFLLQEGQAVNFPLGLFIYQGIIVSKSDPVDNNLQSVVIRSTNRQGALFTFTRITNAKEILFRGRILSRNHSDAFELHEQSGHYFLTKKHQLDLINE